MRLIPLEQMQRRSLTAPKMEDFVIIINGFQMLVIVVKMAICMCRRSATEILDIHIEVIKHILQSLLQPQSEQMLLLKYPP